MEGRTQSALLQLEHVVKRYPETIAVDGLSLGIDAGEFFSLLGPSGCGKTTTLRMIAGLEEPDDGRILLDGADITALAAHRRPVNTVFQSYALFPHLSVFDNVAYGLRRRRVPSDDVRRRVERMLEIVDLPGFGSRKPSQLSGGQQQRTALARALVNEPKVLLLDEPLGALDLKLRRQMQRELKRIQTDVGITFIYVTHDQDEAMTMSDRLAVMNNGRIEQIGVPEEVYERPATEFVAGFIGAANLLSGTVAERDANWARVSLDGGGSVRLPSGALNGSSLVRVGVRPEKIDIVEASADGALGNVLDATIESTAFTGVGHECACRLGGGGLMVVYRQNIGVPPPEPGSAVRLAWRPEHTFAVARREGQG